MATGTVLKTDRSGSGLGFESSTLRAMLTYSNPRQRASTETRRMWRFESSREHVTGSCGPNLAEVLAQTRGTCGFESHQEHAHFVYRLGPLSYIQQKRVRLPQCVLNSA
jgi:hypothetical protein